MSASICILGDIMAGENHYHFGRGIKTLYKSRYQDLVSQDIKDLLKANDLLLFNLEYSFADTDVTRAEDMSRLIYTAGQESLDLFPEGPQKIASIANNHFSQHGIAAAQYTKQKLRMKGIGICGEDKRPVIIQIRDIKFSIWGVSLIKDMHYCNEYFISDYESLAESLELNKEKGDNEKWIISIHWGDEYVKTPSRNQIQLAHRLADRGIDIIVGHHPHVVQPVELYKNTLVFYSLGNFIFDQNFSRSTRTGLFAKLNCSAEGLNNEAYLTRQKVFRVAKLSKMKNIRHDSINPLFYNIRKTSMTIIMRILMKLEFIINIRKTVPSARRFLLKRIKYNKD